MTLASTILDRCASFELRGPTVSLSRVTGSNIEVIRPSSDWSAVVGNKPLVDKRNASLPDLFPRPRAVLRSMMESMERATRAPQNAALLKLPGLG